MKKDGQKAAESSKELKMNAAVERILHAEEKTEAGLLPLTLSEHCAEQFCTKRCLKILN